MRRFLTRIRRGGDEVSPALRVWTALTVLVSVFAITAHEDFGALRFSIAGLVALGFLFSWIRRRRNNTWVKLLLTAGCLWAAWVFLQALSQDPYHTSIPLTIFLLWLQTLHSFDLPRRRDLLFSVLTSVVLMAVAAAFTVDMAFGAFFLPYALAACVTLVYNTAEAGMAAAAGSGGRRCRSPPRCSARCWRSPGWSSCSRRASLGSLSPPCRSRPPSPSGSGCRAASSTPPTRRAVTGHTSSTPTGTLGSVPTSTCACAAGSTTGS